MENIKYDKTILITGGAGFIGANYLNTMVPRYPNYLFIDLDALTYAADLGNLKVASEPNYRLAVADIRDRNAIERIFLAHRPTDIIHFAAESHVDNSISGPHIFFETNVLGTHNLLSLAKEFGIARFHHISTDEVYGSLSHDDTSRTEEDPLAPNSPYSASKASAEHAVRSYNKTFGMDTVITRASNNYGPFQHREKLIPLFISRLIRGEKVPVYGTGANIRDWLHVEDHIEGIDAVFHRGKPGEVYNLGGGTEVDNLTITKKLIELAGLGSEMIEYVTDRPGHDFRYSLDSTKAERELGWKPKKNFDEGMQLTFDFYKDKDSKK